MSSVRLHACIALMSLAVGCGGSDNESTPLQTLELRPHPALPYTNNIAPTAMGLTLKGQRFACRL